MIRPYVGDPNLELIKSPFFSFEYVQIYRSVNIL